MNNFCEQILENISKGTWVVDKNDNFTYFSQSMADISGIPKVEVIGKNLMTYMPERTIGDEVHFKELFLRVKTTLEPAHFYSLPLRNKNGNISYQSGRLVPIVDKNGYYDGMICVIEDVTEQKISEKTQCDEWEAEKRVESIYKSSPVIAFLWTVEKDWPVEFVSNNIIQFGYTPEDFTSGRLIYGDIVHPDDLQKVRDAVSQVEIGGHTYFTKEYRILTKSGEKRWVTERSMLGRTYKGEPAYYQGIIIDITDRKKVEEALRESERKYRLIFENSPLGIFDFDENGVVTSGNENMLKILDLTRDELIGFNMLKSLEDEDMKGALNQVFLKNAGHYEGYYRSTTSNKVVPLKVDFSPIISEDGTVEGGVGIVEDITERKQAEEALIESEKKFRSLFENANDAIFIHDFGGNILEVNQVASQRLGYTKYELVQMKSMDLISPFYEDKVQNRLKTIQEEGHGIFETVQITKSGSKIPIELSSRMIEYEGKPAILALARDITERKRAEKKLNEYATELARANEELKSLDRMKDEFLSNVSHELKTPLTSIKGYSNIIYEETLGELNDKQKKTMGIILRNTERLRRLVDSLIYMSMAQADAIKYSFEPVQIAEIADNAIEDMSLQIDKKGLVLNKNVSENLPQINGDKAKLTDMLTNLFDNAIKFTPSEGQITLDAFEEEGYIHLKITDTGIGIPEDLIPHLFQRFYQIDSSIKRKYGGTGLGLYICKQIVDAHNGEIWINSKEGEGTTVHVRLPKIKE
ncbi:MAG: PAS domain S-box protein [Methanohalobium sp.]|uniref:PAS domain S-box protein n=1 Tax=Methanohalobium sp. TaxID=2837493 RepID=UPI00397D4D44